MTSPLVSIIVPAYKTEKYLSQCLDSILSQTLKDIEIIVVDEGDIDLCRSIIDEYEKKDGRIKTIHEKNGGYGASVNKGINLASGLYVGIVEADDFIDPNMFKSLFEIANKFDSDIVKSDFYYYTTSKNEARKAGKIAKQKANKILNIKTDPSILKIQPSIWSAIYKREFLNSSNVRFLETKGGSYQDTSFSFKALSSAKSVVLTPHAYLYYRVDNENSSVKNSGKVYAICDEYAEITRFLDERPEIKELVNREKLFKQFWAYMWNLTRIDAAFRDEFIERFSLEFKGYFEKGEIDGKVYKILDKKLINALAYDIPSFKLYTENYICKKEKKEKRNKNFSIRINSSRISVVLFGKQVIAFDF